MSPGHDDLVRWTRAGIAIALSLPVLCIGAAAQTPSPTQTVYAVCVASTAPAQYVYMTNVFGVENSVGRKLRDAWEQYVRSQYANVNVGSINCGASQTQDQAETGRQNAVNAFSQLAQKLGAAAPQLVQVQWQYQQSAGPPPAAPAASSSAPSAGSANPAQAIGKNASATGTNIAKNTQQSFDQSLQSMENTSTGTVTGAAATVSNSVNGSVQQGINKLFHKHGANAAKPTANQPARSDNLLATSGGPLLVPGTSPAPQTDKTTVASPQAAAANPAATAGTSTASAQPDPGMSIQDEGDGKHFLLITAGKSDAQELTLQAGSKNVYIDESTGDKFVVMANGKIIRVPHKPATNNGK